jgi:hypothetical protein
MDFPLGRNDKTTRLFDLEIVLTANGLANHICFHYQLKNYLVRAVVIVFQNRGIMLLSVFLSKFY